MCVIICYPIATMKNGVNERMRFYKRVTALTLILCLALVLAPGSAQAAYASLRPGERGTEVRAMQQALSSLGYSLTVDGAYGPLSEASVRSFQRQNSLKEDGIAGNQTLSLLYRMAPAFDPGSGSGATPVYPPSEGSVTPSGRLELGSFGSEVVALQNKLNSLGHNCGRNDGVFDIATRDAVSAYQISAGLPADGVAGAQTLAALFGTALPEAPAPTASPASGTPSLSGRLELGSSGNEVALLQARLIALGYAPGRTDGSFDAGTRSAVVNFQSRNGLKADGIAGPLTLQKVYSDSAIGPASSSGGGTATGSAIVSTGNTGPLRFRGTPSSADSRNIIGSLNNGQVVEVLDGIGTWSRIRAGGVEGYAMTRFLSFSASPAPSPSPSPSPVPGDGAGQPTTPPVSGGGAATVLTPNGGSVRLRSGATTSGNNVLASIPNKAAVQVQSVAGTWAYITWQSRTGYVMMEFIRMDQAAPTPVPAPGATEDPLDEEEGGYPRTLRSGDSGDDVRRLQLRLQELKYTVNVSSSYDSVTVSAVRAFQNVNGLKVDGVFGPASAGVIVSTAARGADSTPLSYTTLRMGDTDGADKAVSKMQQRLIELGFSLTADGSFGIKTHDAIVSFQQQNGISVSGIADAQTQARVYASDAKQNTGSTPGVDISEGKIGGPSASSVKLLRWYDEVKPALGGSPTVRVYHPASGVSFNIQMYSLGRHADAEPKTLKDTQLMNAAFGPASWNTRPVYVQLPNGTWTLATMHNYPHLSGSISNNGFGGHLCIHFLRDLEETQKVDPNYGMQNQRAIRNAWKSMTGEDVQ